MLYYDINQTGKNNILVVLTSFFLCLISYAAVSPELDKNADC